MIQSNQIQTPPDTHLIAQLGIVLFLTIVLARLACFTSLDMDINFIAVLRRGEKFSISRSSRLATRLVDRLSKIYVIWSSRLDMIAGETFILWISRLVLD